MASAAQQSQTPLAIPVVGVCDLSQRTYFSQVVTGGQVFSFINRPADVTRWELEVFIDTGVLTWPAGIRWIGGTAPQNLQVNKFHRFFFEVSQINNTILLGSYLPNL